MKLSSKAANKTSRVLVYGGPKTGKTKLVGKLASAYDLVYFDLENGYETLLKLPQEQQERIELISIPDSRVFPIAIETLLKVVTGNKVTICEEHGKVNCPVCTKAGAATTTVELNALQTSSIVVFDSITQLANSAMSFITKDKPDDYKYEWDDYRRQGTVMDKFLSQIQQAKYNVVCITHETETEMEDGKKKLVPVAGTTTFSRNTAKYFDHVVYAELKNRKHIFASSTTYATNVITGSRLDIEVEDSLLPIFQRDTIKPLDQGTTALNGLKKLQLGGVLKK